MGVEPISPTVQRSVAARDMQARVIFVVREVRPGIEPGLPPYHGGVLPKHLQTKVIPDGIEPSFPGRQPSVVAVGPRDGYSSSRGGSRTHKVTRLSTSPLFRFAYPAVFQLQVRESHPAREAYETSLSTGPPASK
jgi:hypothetical protein